MLMHLSSNSVKVDCHIQIMCSYYWGTFWKHLGEGKGNVPRAFTALLLPRDVCCFPTRFRSCHHHYKPLFVRRSHLHLPVSGNNLACSWFSLLADSRTETSAVVVEYAFQCWIVHTSLSLSSSTHNYILQYGPNAAISTISPTRLLLCKCVNKFSNRLPVRGMWLPFTNSLFIHFFPLERDILGFSVLKVLDFIIWTSPTMPLMMPIPPKMMRLVPIDMAFWGGGTNGTNYVAMLSECQQVIHWSS